MKSMAKSRKFHWGLFLSPPIDSIAYRERHSCCLFVCLFARSKQQLKGSVCISFSSVWSIVSFRHGESVENILFNPLRDLVRLLFDSPQKSPTTTTTTPKRFLRGVSAIIYSRAMRNSYKTYTIDDR